MNKKQVDEMKEKNERETKTQKRIKQTKRIKILQLYEILTFFLSSSCCTSLSDFAIEISNREKF